MSLELYDGSLSGIKVKYYVSAIFNFEEPELELFEKQFPFKEKHITDTQLK